MAHKTIDSEIQKTFNKVIDAGFYDAHAYPGVSDNYLMCLAMQSAMRFGIISLSDMVKAKSEITSFLRDDSMISLRSMLCAMACESVESEQKEYAEHNALKIWPEYAMRIYKDWENRHSHIAMFVREIQNLSRNKIKLS